MLYHLIFISVITLDYFLGFFVFLKNKKKFNNVLFLLFNFFAATWLFTLYLFYNIENEPWLLIVGRFNFVSVIVFTYFMFLFVYNFPVILFKIKKKYLFLLSVETFLLSVITVFTDLISKSENFVGDQIITTYGSLYFLFILHYLLYFLFIIIILVYKYRKLIGLEKLQIRYLIWGFAISAIIGSITNILLPLLGIYSFQEVGILCVVVSVFMIAYAILRYRLMDIRVIIRRSAVFAVLIVAITSVYALFAYLISISFQGIIGTQSFVLTGVITAVLVAIGFEPLKTWLSRVTDKYLFQAEYNTQEIVAEFADRLSSNLDLQQNTEFLVNRLNKVLKPIYVSVFLLVEDKNQYCREAVVGNTVIDFNKIDQKLFNTIFKHLKDLGIEKKIVVREEIHRINEETPDKELELLYKILDKYGVNLVVPLYLRDKLVGILFLGDRKSGDVYSQQDIKLLEIIAVQSVTAIENSSLYKEVNDLNKNLQKKVEEQTKDIVEKNKKLEQLLKVKSEFLDIASHQLRTPVSVICGILDMFKSGAMDKLPKAKQMEFIGSAFIKGKKLNSVINDILDASDLDEKELDLSDSISELNLAELVKKVIDYNQMEIKGKKLNMKTNIAKDVMVKGDTRYLEQAISNLLDNAIKYTPEGKNIEISLAKKDKKVLLAIKDEGIGIPQKEHDNLFKKFTRASNAKEIHTDGSGLGLFIVKKIIDAHPQAKIWFESPKSKGATFYIEFLNV